MKENQKVTFNIVNFRSSHSFINLGMKISMFSERNYIEKGTEWEFIELPASYFKNNIKRLIKNKIPNGSSFPTEGEYISYYTLSFSYTFYQVQDRVYFCYHVPYSFTNLMQIIKEICIINLNQKSNFKIINPNNLYKELEYENENKELKALSSDVNPEQQSKEVMQQIKTIKKVNSHKELIKDHIISNFKKNFETINIMDSEFEISNESYIYMQERLCLTLSGLPIHLITITSNVYYKKKFHISFSKKICIYNCKSA